MTRRRSLIAAALGLAAARGALAQMTIVGETFPARMRVGGVDLLLNGVGTRSVAWIHGYAAGLYLSRRVASPEEAVAAPGPKRIQLRMLQTAPAQEFVKAVDKGFRRNTPPEEQPGLDARRAAFNAQLLAARQVKKGDVVDLDYIPGRGLVFVMNGRSGGADIPGEDLYGAVLRIFLGRRPVDAKMKAGLLGLPPP